MHTHTHTHTQKRERERKKTQMNIGIHKEYDLLHPKVPSRTATMTTTTMIANVFLCILCVCLVSESIN